MILSPGVMIASRYMYPQRHHCHRGTRSIYCRSPTNDDVSRANLTLQLIRSNMNKWVLYLLVGVAISIPISAESRNIYLGASYVASDHVAYSNEDIYGYETNIGYKLSKHLTVEVNYFDLEKYEEPSEGGVGWTSDTSGRSALVGILYPIDKFTVYAKFGRLWWRQKGIIDGFIGLERYKIDSKELIKGIAISYHITKHILVKVDYKVTKVRMVEMKLSSVGIEYHF